MPGELWWTVFLAVYVTGLIVIAAVLGVRMATQWLKRTIRQAITEASHGE